MKSAIDRIDALLISPQVADGAKEKLGDVKGSLDEQLKNLTETERFIVFTEEKTSSVIPSIYEILETGVVSLKDKVDALVRPSLILGPLYKQGFDFKSLHKFSQDEVDLSAAIGDNFVNLSGPLRALRSAVKDDKDERFNIAFPERDDAAFAKLWRLNERFKFLEIRSLSFKSREGRYFKFRPDMEGKVKNEQKGIFSFRFTTGVARSLILGDWMTSYVYGIVKDQLQRMDIESELFAKLSYRAPGDVIAHSSDFDVISRYGDSVIMFECKSGRLSEENATGIQKKADELISALIPTGADDQVFESHLVYDPFINNPDEVRRLFEDSDINVLPPSDVRRLVIEVIRSGA